MGGSGSGLYGNGGWIGRDTVESKLCLDIRVLKPGLDSGNTLIFKWRYREKRFSPPVERELKIATHSTYLLFQTPSDEYTVGLSWTNCNYGGKRPWFVCTGCGKRRGKLFFKKEKFLCRECHDLTYISCQVSGNKLEELDNKLYKLARKLQMKDFKPYDLHPLFFKPKGMHQETFDRLRSKLEWLLIKRQEAWIAGCRFHS
ncbi:hypothetical protein [Bacillus sp. CHD6a]|uniref:hypothetical protein n=1 Tax=Bacillus sp. CHD6a TaxID=1643452 RepID=UPI00076105F9|nr:hypothetical protein [Bacillus sp. CHD6a]